MMNRFRAPYAHVNLVVCETMDRYKATIRDKVKAWVDERIEKQVQFASTWATCGYHLRSALSDVAQVSLSVIFKPSRHKCS